VFKSKKHSYFAIDLSLEQPLGCQPLANNLAFVAVIDIDGGIEFLHLGGRQ
jgi:hypothetical protein